MVSEILQMEAVMDEMKELDPKLNECTCDTIQLFAWGHSDECPYRMAQQPKPTACTCYGDFVEDEYVGHDMCRCGIDNAHSHCTECKGWVTLG